MTSTLTRWGLIRRKERWTLTPLAWVLLASAFVGLVVWGRTAIHPFLAQIETVNAEVLVVEGWLPDYALEGAVKEFHSHPYLCVITTGGPLDVGETLTSYNTYAALCAASLANLGVDSAKIVAIPAPRLRVNRTFASALSLKRWLTISGANLRSFNLYSLGIHARRSRLLFQKALGNSVPLGVIAADDHSYDPNRWWEYSSGVEGVIFETVGYLYVKLLFPLSAEHAFSAE